MLSPRFEGHFKLGHYKDHVTSPYKRPFDDSQKAAMAKALDEVKKKTLEANPGLAGVLVYGPGIDAERELLTEVDHVRPDKTFGIIPYGKDAAVVQQADRTIDASLEDALTSNGIIQRHPTAGYLFSEPSLRYYAKDDSKTIMENVRELATAKILDILDTFKFLTNRNADNPLPQTLDGIQENLDALTKEVAVLKKLG